LLEKEDVMKRNVFAPCLAILLVTAVSSSAPAMPFSHFPTVLISNTVTSNGEGTGTSIPDVKFLGAPDHQYGSLYTRDVIYDFGVPGVTNGAGADLYVYEADTSFSEFSKIWVRVSADGQNYVNTTGSASPTTNAGIPPPRIPGDEEFGYSYTGTSGGPQVYVRSYELPSDMPHARYVWIDGTNGGSSGLELDAVGAVHQPVPLPARLFLLGPGLGALAVLKRRMKR
jgi:hypothetical protein